jgi:hypothetical protein
MTARARTPSCCLEPEQLRSGMDRGRFSFSIKHFAAAPAIFVIGVVSRNLACPFLAQRNAIATPSLNCSKR